MGIREIVEHLERVEKRAKPEVGVALYFSKEGPHPKDTLRMLMPTWKGEVKAIHVPELGHPLQEKGSTVGIIGMKTLDGYKPLVYYHNQQTERSLSVEKRPEEGKRLEWYKSRDKHLIVYKQGNTFGLDIHETLRGTEGVAQFIARVYEEPEKKRRTIHRAVDELRIEIADEWGVPKVYKRLEVAGAVRSLPEDRLDRELVEALKRAKERLGIDVIGVVARLRAVKEEFHRLEKRGRVSDVEISSRELPQATLSIILREGVKPNDDHRDFLEVLKEALWNRLVGDEEGFREALKRIKKLVGA